MEMNSIFLLAPLVLTYGIAVMAFKVQHEEAVRKAKEEGHAPPMSQRAVPRMVHVLFMGLILGWTAMLYQDDRHDAQIDRGLSAIKAESVEAAWVVDTMQECIGHFGASASGCAASTMSLAQSRGDRPNTRNLIIRWGQVHELRTGLESDQQR